MILIVENREGPNKDEVMGKTRIPLSLVPICLDHKFVPNKWYYLENPSMIDLEMKETKFASRIHLRIFLDGGYHVLDESTQYSSNLRPTTKKLWKRSIGVLKVGILSAQGLLFVFIDNLLGPIPLDTSLLNSVIEIWYGPSLLPKRFGAMKDLVDFVEGLLELAPANLNLVLSISRLIGQRYNL